jgi:hypothetical protein
MCVAGVVEYTDPDASSPHSIANLGTQLRPRPMVVFESFVCDRL